MGYVTKEDGNPVDENEAQRIRGVAWNVWMGFVHNNEAPDTWKPCAPRLKYIYYKELYSQFPYLSHCADNWKAEEIAITYYPGFARTHVKTQKKEGASSLGSVGDKRHRNKANDEGDGRKKVRRSHPLSNLLCDSGSTFSLDSDTGTGNVSPALTGDPEADGLRAQEDDASVQHLTDILQDVHPPSFVNSPFARRERTVTSSIDLAPAASTAPPPPSGLPPVASPPRSHRSSIRQESTGATPPPSTSSTAGQGGGQRRCR